MGEVYRSNELLALWLRLGLVAIERYAARDGDTFRVHRSELGDLAGQKRRDKAEALLQRLATELELSVNLVGSYWEIEWPKFSQKQGFTEKNGAGIANPDTDALRPPPLKGGGHKSLPREEKETEPRTPLRVARPAAPPTEVDSLWTPEAREKADERSAIARQATAPGGRP